MEFSEELIKIFDYIGEKMGIVIDWSNDNVIPYVKDLCSKYINYELATSIFSIIVVSIILLLCGIGLFRLIRWEYEITKYDDDCCPIIGLTVIFAICILGIIIVTFLFPEISDILKCIYFPELQIYDFITSLINT